MMGRKKTGYMEITAEAEIEITSDEVCDFVTNYATDDDLDEIAKAIQKAKYGARDYVTQITPEIPLSGTFGGELIVRELLRIANEYTLREISAALPERKGVAP